MAACGQGSLMFFPMMATHVTLTQLDCAYDTPPAVISAAVAGAVKIAIQTARMQLLQPMMVIQVRVNPEHVGVVLNDLTAKRNAQISLVEPSDYSHLIQPTPQLVKKTTRKNKKKKRKYRKYVVLLHTIFPVPKIVVFFTPDFHRT